MCVCACVPICARTLQVAQSSLSLCDPMDCSPAPPGSSIHGISQARILEWLPSPTPGDRPDPGIEPLSLPPLGLEVESLPLPHLGSPIETCTHACAVLCLVTQSRPTLCDSMDCPPGSSVLGFSPGKNTGVGYRALLQGIFPTQGSNPGLLHCRQILYPLSHQASPRIVEWVPILSPGDLPDPGIEPESPAFQADSLPAELPGKPIYTYICIFVCLNN